MRIFSVLELELNSISIMSTFSTVCWGIAVYFIRDVRSLPLKDILTVPVSDLITSAVFIIIVIFK